MQLDKTEVAIRERNLLQILDLSLIVVRRHAGPLLATLLLGAVPMAILNYWLVGWMANDERISRAGYCWSMATLVAFEAPLACAALSWYLGRVMFFMKPKAKEIFTDLPRPFARLIWSEVVVRCLWIVWLLYFGYKMQNSMNSPAYRPRDEDWAILFWLIVPGCIRLARPFTSFVVLLERAPIFRRKNQALNIRRRSKVLHAGEFWDQFLRWLMAAALAIAVATSLVVAIWFFVGNSTNEWTWNWTMRHMLVPAALWITAGYFTVVRFLSYLDLRIRREGWELELLLRAEATRLEATKIDGTKADPHKSSPETSPGTKRPLARALTLLLAAMFAWGFVPQVSLAAGDPVEDARKGLTDIDPPWYDAPRDQLRPLPNFSRQSAQEQAEMRKRFKEQGRFKWKQSADGRSGRAGSGTGSGRGSSGSRGDQARRSDSKSQSRSSSSRSSSSYTPPESSDTFGAAQVIMWIILGIILAIVIGMVVRAWLNRENKKNPSKNVKIPATTAQRPVADLPLPTAPKGTLLDEIRRLYERGEFNQAMLYFYSYLLIELDKHRLIRLARGKTNRTYLRETPARTPSRQILAAAIPAFEDVYFGGLKITRQQFDSCWNQLNAFHQQTGHQPMGGMPA